jgi:hypothetical protein
MGFAFGGVRAQKLAETGPANLKRASKAGVVMLMETMAFDSDYANGTTIYSSHAY